MSRLTVVVPVASWDYEPCKIFLKTLNHNFDHHSIDKVIIFFPDKPKMEDTVEKLNLNFDTVILTEKDVIPQKDYNFFKKRPGWFRQQIVKILVSRIIDTELYICLDADLICYRKTSYADLVIDGKPLVNIEPKTLHKRWWQDSRKVLKMKDLGYENGMSSSTNILIKSEVESMIAYLEDKYKKSLTKILLNWVWIHSKIFKVFWTEYTLYWSFIELQGNTDRYNWERKIWGKSMWKKSKVSEELFEEMFSSNNEGFFTVWQPTLISPELIRQKIKDYMNVQV